MPNSSKSAITLIRTYTRYIMEAEERPTKLRKLDTQETAAEVTAVTPLLSDATATLPESCTAEPSHTSKPEEHTANDADSAAEASEDEHESDGGVATEPQHPSQENGEPAKPMSKNQIKKQRKREEWEAARDYRKVKRKQKLQEKRARKKAAREEAAEQEQQDGDTAPDLQLQRQPKPKYRRPVQLPVTILIDCGFDDLMMEKERISLGSQITRSYSDNYRAPFQAHLVISSWGGLLKERFDTVLSKHYLNWKNVVIEENDFVEAAKKADEFMRGPSGGKMAGMFERFAAPDGVVKHDDSEKVDGNKVHASNGNRVEVEAPDPSLNTAESVGYTSTIPENPESAQKDIPPSDSTGPLEHTGEIVYLTSDSPETLTELSPYSTYIVGGLVDKNRHKGICYKIAKERGIKTAKLPIGDYLEMASRKVLATNHVVEIMIRWLECGDWGEAFMKVIPKRKGVKLREDEDEHDQQDSPATNDNDEVEHDDAGDQEEADDKPIEASS
ncbi:guanine-1-methyltransferase-domain-containing protein [Exophiala viscosa]|uniref:tRNA (guanine(9)-N1)-methyltransferase n=1 Tax=Exophiala viscosa TaxID=2486360 RepID=A0AAN6DM02_9EURO|nr:guanine-1-methyltransferase-domain-containing protein [Exophiala viscosa]